ncbi:MAG TPA: hypothetical protein VFT22_20260 [Kofleriaceae bacterium]|nr:hypothetical protein [Kofleriaceae bacterium]
MHFDPGFWAKIRPQDGGRFAHWRQPAVPRRTRPSSKTTALQTPIKRKAPTNETPTLALTPIEIDSIVQGAPAEVSAGLDEDGTPTVENFRLALGSSSIACLGEDRESLDRPDAPAESARGASSTMPPVPAALPERTAPSPDPLPRGQRRTRETLRADAIKPPDVPPTRKR